MDCCLMVTTTPKPKTCATYTCPTWWIQHNDQTVCPIGGCNRGVCCLLATTTPVPTTTPTTCGSFSCRAPWEMLSKMSSRWMHQCGAGGCKAEDCCALATTTPTPITCASFHCATTPGWVADPSKTKKQCQNVGATNTTFRVNKVFACDRKWCCMVVTTTPTPTTTPQTCASFKCGGGGPAPAPTTQDGGFDPDGGLDRRLSASLRPFAATLLCPSGGCSQTLCCVWPTTTPATTTLRPVTCVWPAYDCFHSKIEKGWTPKSPMPQKPCGLGGCTRRDCCTFANLARPIVATWWKANSTCSSFTCPGSPWTTRPELNKEVCTYSKCAKEQCCKYTAIGTAVVDSGTATGSLTAVATPAPAPVTVAATYAPVTAAAVATVSTAAATLPPTTTTKELAWWQGGGGLLDRYSANQKQGVVQEGLVADQKSVKTPQMPLVSMLVHPASLDFFDRALLGLAFLGFLGFGVVVYKKLRRDHEYSSVYSQTVLATSLSGSGSEAYSSVYSETSLATSLTESGSEVLISV